MSPLLFQLATAATLQAPGVGGTIQEVIDAAAAGDTVDIAPGTYNEALFVDTQLTLRGTAAGVVIAPDAVGRGAIDVLAGTVLTLRQLEVRPSNGRALYAEASTTIQIEDALLQGESAGDGGAIWFGGNSFTLESSIVTGTSGGNGGAIFATGFSNQVFDSTISGTATGVGGGIYSDATILGLNLVTLDASSATDGGALFTSATTVALSDTVIDGATATTSGGAIYLNGVDELAMTRTVICDASAGTSGGAVYATGVNGVVNASAFGGNDATFGAGWFIKGGDWTFQHLTAVENNGSAIEFSIDAATATIDHSLFLDNGAAVNTAGAVTTRAHNGFGGNLFDIVGNVPDATSLTGLAIDFQGWPLRCDLAAFLPTFDAPVLDAGTTLDPDGSLGDLGATGGPDTDPDLHDDDDNDGFTDAKECNDQANTVFPDAPEICDDRDNDCDQLIDIADPDLDLTSILSWWPDLDHDGFGDRDLPAGTEIISCSAPGPDYAPNGADCDDDDPAIRPTAEETCDPTDQNCDGDPLFEAIDAVLWFLDDDDDGFGANNVAPVLACIGPDPRWVSDAGDCDDTDGNVKPGAIEACNGYDDNCDGSEADALDIRTWYPDADADGYPDQSLPVLACDQPTGTFPPRPDNAFDCEDQQPLANPGLVEVCDQIDNDCSGIADDLTAVPPRWFADDDGDGFGSNRSNAWVETDCPEPGYVADNTDCDDLLKEVYPGAPELCNDRDDDCSGVADDGPTSTFYVDADGDGYGNDLTETTDSCVPADAVLQGGDCFDSLPDINPGAEEVPGNDVDENCDGIAEAGDLTATGGGGVTPRKGCQCDSGSSAPTPWLLAFALPFLRRRNG